MKPSSLSRRNLLASATGAAGLAALPSSAVGKTERLKITKIEMFRVAVPMQDDIIYSPEYVETPLFSMVPKWILKVHTDSGLIGIGESGRGADGARLRTTADAIIGKNVFDFNLTSLDLPDRHGAEAFEAALYDIVGKAVGWPVYRLLGGLAQRKVLVGYWCGRKNAEDMRRVARRAKAGNFTTIKIKCKLEDPVVDVIQAIADEAPGIKAIVDPNERFYSYEQALPIAKELDRIGNMLVLEDPIPKKDHEGYRKLRDQVSYMVCHHQSNPLEMIRAYSAGACDMFNTSPASMPAFVSNCYIARAMKYEVWHGSSHDMGIRDASYLHACAAASNCTYPSDILSYQRVDDLIVEPIEIRDSYAIVSDRPGLGVELDDDAVKKYAVSMGRVAKG